MFLKIFQHWKIILIFPTGSWCSPPARGVRLHYQEAECIFFSAPARGSEKDLAPGARRRKIENWKARPGRGAEWYPNPGARRIRDL